MFYVCRRKITLRMTRQINLWRRGKGEADGSNIQNISNEAVGMTHFSGVLLPLPTAYCVCEWYDMCYIVPLYFVVSTGREIWLLESIALT